MKYNLSTTQSLTRVKVVMLSFFLLATSKASIGQSLQWVKSVVGNNLVTSVALASDNMGNSHQTGRFLSLLDFDTDAGIDTINAGFYTGNVNSVAAYISKTSPAGNHLWARGFIPYNNNGNASGVAVDIDNSGNVLSIGHFKGIVDFDPGPGIDTVSTFPFNEVSYIAKLDISGNYLWAKKIENSLQGLTSSVYAVKTGNSNSIYIYGIFTGTVDFDLGPGVNNVTAATVSNYLLKLDSNGDFLWVKTWDNSSNNINSGGNRLMAIDANDNLYICLGFSAVDTLDVDPGPSVNDLIGKNFLVKIDSSGNFIWGGGCTAASLQVHLDPFDAVYTTGSFGIGADVDPGPGVYNLNVPGDVFLSKSNVNGNLLWVKKFEDISVQHITTDASGNIFYAWGSGANAIDCDPDTGSYMIHGPGSKYILCGLDSSGAFKWAKKTHWTTVCNNTGLRLNVTSANDLMIAGRYCHVLDVDFSPAVYNIGQVGTSSSFLMKYNYCGTTNNIFYTSCDSVVLPDTTYLVATNYVNEYLDVTNCDSNVNIHVNILTQQNEFVINACDTVNYFGQIYTQTGTYTQIVPNAIGCDSVHTLHININTPAGLPPFLNLVQTFQPYFPPLPGAFTPTSLNVEVDSLYNMYISGTFSQEIDFNPLGVPYIDTSLYPLYGVPDGFVTRYDSSGILTWMHKIQTNDVLSGNEFTPALCLNDALELYSATYGKGASNIGMNKVNQFAYANTWFGTTLMAGYSILNVNQILNDPTSNLPVKIGFHDSIDFNYAYKKLVVWRGNNSATFSTGGQYIGMNGAVDSQGNIYVVSNMQPIFNGPTYCMIAKLDSNLNMLWNKQIAEGNDIPPVGMKINQLKIDTNGSLLLCGRFSDTLDIDISPNTYNLISNGGFDAFIARFDTSANFIWAQSYGGADDDFANSIITDMNGKIYVGGNFTSTAIDLDPTAGISFLMKGCLNADWGGGYISKYKADGTFLKAMGSGKQITELEFKAPQRIYATGIPFIQVFDLLNDIIVNVTDTICMGDSLIVGNSVYTQTGTYIDTFALPLGIDSIVITNLTVITAAIVANASDTSICIGNSVILYGSGGISYTWNNGVIDSVAFLPAVTNTYVVTGTDLNGCTNQDSITVVVSLLPLVTANASDTLVCAGDSVLLFGTGANVYIWNNLVVNNVLFSPNATNTYLVTGTDINGCTNQDSITIAVNPLPIVTANASDSVICFGDSVLLYGSGADSYTWNNLVLNNVLFSPNVTNTYVVTGTDINGCTNQDSITIIVNPLPVPIITINFDTLFCTNIPGANIYWYNDTVLVDSLTNYYVFTQNGNYHVVVKDTNGCEGQASILLHVGISETVITNSIVVFPNPTNRDINIAFELPERGEVDLMINDLLGRKIYTSKRKITSPGKQLLNIDLSKNNLNTGIYFLNINIEGRRQVVKIEYQKE